MFKNYDDLLSKINSDYNLDRINDSKIKNYELFPELKNKEDINNLFKPNENYLNDNMNIEELESKITIYLLNENRYRIEHYRDVIPKDTSWSKF